MLAWVAAGSIRCLVYPPHPTAPYAGQAAALAYARKHFASFQAAHMADIQRLMGAMLFHARPAQHNPYAPLLASSGLSWEGVAQEFARQACSVLGQVRSAAPHRTAPHH